MVLAEKYNYMEEESRLQQPVYKQPPLRRVQQAPAKRTGSKVVSVLLVGICFATACLVIARYSQISKNHNQILALNQSLEEELTRKENLKVDLAFTEDLNSIEAAAEKTLGMNYPGEDQVVYVDLPDIKADPQEPQVIEKPVKSFWSRLLGFLD